MAADRGKFVDQSQSLNLFIADPNYDKLTAMHFYGWKKGLKVRIVIRSAFVSVTMTANVWALLGNRRECTIYGQKPQ